MRWLLTIIIAIAAGFGGAAAFSYSGLGGNATRAYLMDHPEVLPAAMQVLQSRDTVARIKPIRAALDKPFPGAVLGNPDGKVTLVEFTDYACTYCRHSVADVDALIRANPDLRVVIREYPILTAESANAARMALAAAEQGKFAAFHHNMFNEGQVTKATIVDAAKASGIDLAKADAAIKSGQFEPQLQNNFYLAQQLGITGTPSWVIGNQAFDGAVGEATLARAVSDARKLD